MQNRERQVTERKKKNFFSNFVTVQWRVEVTFEGVATMLKQEKVLETVKLIEYPVRNEKRFRMAAIRHVSRPTIEGEIWAVFCVETYRNQARLVVRQMQLFQLY